VYEYLNSIFNRIKIKIDLYLSCHFGHLKSKQDGNSVKHVWRG